MYAEEFDHIHDDDHADDQKQQDKRDSNNNPLRHQQVNSHSHSYPPVAGDAVVHRAPIQECLLFFFTAAGCTVGWTSVLSNLLFYTDTLGADSFLYLNFTIFAPLFPVTWLQTLYDSHFDRRFQSVNTFSFRGTASFAVTVLCTMALPWASTSLPWLSTTCFFLGTSSAVLHGMLKQMSSFTYPNCGRLSVAVTAGLQASALLVLIVSFITGFGRTGNSTGLKEFYFLISALVILGWFCFHFLMRYSRDVQTSMLRRDLSMDVLSERLLLSSNSSSNSNEEEDEEHEEEGGLLSLTSTSSRSFIQEMSVSELWKTTWLSCISIMVTVASSTTVASYFNRVKSHHHYSTDIFPQILFYTRLFADLMGRPATLGWAFTSVRCLCAISILRLLFVPVFFLYISTELIPKNDALAVLFVFLFAFSSGYIVTLSYQISPRLLDQDKRELNIMKQASLLNIGFSAAVVLGLVLAVIIRGAIAFDAPE